MIDVNANLEFKQKVRLLGNETIERLKDISSFNEEHYQLALLDLVTESYIERIRKEPEGKNWFTSSAEAMFKIAMDKIRKD